MNAEFNADLPWIIIGYGRVGQALSLLADQLDIEVIGTWNRTHQAAEAAVVPSNVQFYGELHTTLQPLFDEARLIWLTVVDDAIANCFQAISESIYPGSVVVHTSGSQPSTILQTEADLAVASLHPLQAISDPYTAVQRFSQCHWTVEGDDRAVDVLTQLVEPAGIVPIRIPREQKVLYHASAVTAANLLVSLFDAAISMAREADIDSQTARKMLVELGRSSLENLADLPPSRALTGPAARGDIAVIERHRRALKDCDDPSLLEIYELLTQRALDRLAE